MNRALELPWANSYPAPASACRADMATVAAVAADVAKSMRFSQQVPRAKVPLGGAGLLVEERYIISIDVSVDRHSCRVRPGQCRRVGRSDSMNIASELRIWRLRKRNLYVDAELRRVEGTSEFELLIYYGTTLTSSRRCATRADAVVEATTRRAELEREGWTFHW